VQLQDGIGNGSADGPVKFYQKGYCRDCGGVQLLNLTTLRCAVCNRKQV
jgi:hypothetical protein